MTPLIIHADRDRLAAGLAALVAEDLRAALRARGRASIAVPGGTTPEDFLAALAASQLDWARISVLPGDERWAPPDDPRSNEAMIRRAMAPAPAAGFLPFWRIGESPERAAALISAALAPALPLDVAVIGMGADMHCASLFPGAAALADALAPDAPPVAAIRAPRAAEPRVTLTLPALAGAGRLYLLITGAEKRVALRAALAERNGTRAPVGAVLRAARAAEVHWAP